MTTLDDQRPRLSDYGVPAGAHPRGRRNAITDVPGVHVGHATIVDETLNTGVTAIVPAPLVEGRRALAAGLSVANGFGKLVGSTQLRELGEIETPVLLTSTLSAFRVADALVAHVLAWPHHADTTSLNPVVGETNDGFLSDIRARAVGADAVAAAFAAASAGEVAEGAVGAGAGTVTMGYKGGIGTASRVVDLDGVSVTVGVLVQSNYSGTLRVAGVELPAAELLDTEPAPTVGNSCMIVVATDAPLDARQLGRVANRATFSLRASGSDMAHGSGDYAIAFSVSEPRPPRDAQLDGVLLATMEATEEALANSVLRARTVTGPEGRTARAVPVDAVRDRLRRAGVLS